jgi:hypothetical protein
MKRKRSKLTPVYDAYKATCEMDEILFFTGVKLMANSKPEIHHPGIWEPCQGVHHIWSLNRRPDVLSNLVGVNYDGHDADHSGTRSEPVFVRLLSMLAKAEKARKTFDAEFVVADLNRCAGKSVYGWTMYAATPAWCEPYLCDLLTLIQLAMTKEGIEE